MGLAFAATGRCVVALAMLLASATTNAYDCPRTLGSDKSFETPWPEAPSWYGTEGLAVILPVHGAWRTVPRATKTSVKLFWFSTEFQAAANSRFSGRNPIDFTVSIRRLDEGPDDAEVSGPTWAGPDGLGGVWTQLIGIDFRGAGCWEITGRFLNEYLRFVVETVDSVDSGAET